MLAFGFHFCNYSDLYSLFIFPYAVVLCPLFLVFILLNFRSSLHMMDLIYVSKYLLPICGFLKGLLGEDVSTFDVITFLCLRDVGREIANAREAVCDTN